VSNRLVSFQAFRGDGMMIYEADEIMQGNRHDAAGAPNLCPIEPLLQTRTGGESTRRVFNASSYPTPRQIAAAGLRRQCCAATCPRCPCRGHTSPVAAEHR
jgi:hypothetical protein